VRLILLLACGPKQPPETAPESPLERLALESDGQEAVAWRFHGDRAIAVDLLGEDAVGACEAALAEGYDTCAIRLADCATVILTSSEGGELTVVLDAGGCRNALGEVRWLVLDEDKALPPKKVP